MLDVVRLCAALALLWSAAGCGRTVIEPPPDAGPEVDRLFVAVGGNGTLLVSFDGIDWTPRASGVTAHLSGVAAGPSRFVAVGSGGAIVHSPDGLVWAQADSPTPHDLRDVIYARDRFVAVGEDWTDGAVALTSSDGVAWTTLDVPPSTFMFHAVAHGQSALIAAAYFRSDLQTPAQFHWAPGSWVQRTGPDFYDSLFARGTILVTGGQPSVSLSSDDGESWETHALDTTALVSGLAFDGATFVAVGEFGTLFSSPDGRTWTRREHPLGSQGSSYAAAYGAGRFVAVGAAGRAVTSADGATWVAHTLPTGEILSDVAHGLAR